DRLADLGRHRAGLEGRGAEAETRLRARDAEDARQAVVERFCQSVVQGLDALTREGPAGPSSRRTRAGWPPLKGLIDRIVLGPEAIEIHGILPATAPSPADPNRPPAQEHAVSYEPTRYTVIVPSPRGR